LRNVSLRLEPGESVGLIGHNGAGKTTLLRLLARITRPTSGRVRTRGRVASLINLGAGFHPELTGRENIYLNGVILGLTRREVRERFDVIVEFADLGPYMDTPLKRYSSGMFARLGFAVAAHVDPDVLLVDEVLSVGDVAFQDRSIRKMLSFRDAGRAILFVSHNLSAVEMMCQRSVWLDHGLVRQVGPTAEVVRAYLDTVDEALIREAHGSAGSTQDAARPAETEVQGHEMGMRPRLAGDAAPTEAGEAWTARAEQGTSHSKEAVEFEDATLWDAEGRPSEDFEYGEPLAIRLRWWANAEVADVRCEITVRGDYGPLFTAHSAVFEHWSRGARTLECRFDALPLLPGLYRLEVHLEWAGAPTSVPHTVAAFRVVTDLKAFGSDSPVGVTKSRGGFLAVAYDWRVQSGAGDQALAGLRLPHKMVESRRP
jgi:ABC-type polysaccharide/polyol phosphate transport system ATPase subunit